MNVNVPASLHDRFKAATAAEGKQMSEVLLEFIERYVKDAKYPVSRSKKERS
jgi:hypothetical protein